MNDIIASLQENIGGILWGALLILLVLLGAKAANKLVSAAIRRVRDKRQTHESPEAHKRIDTVLTLLHSVMRYGVYIIAAGMILSVLGLSRAAGALLATAGIGGIAIGFGAQSLVKDIVNGMFLLFENQYSVGDYIQVSDCEGTVEAIAVRTTYLRAPTGEQIILPNGSITKVVNQSRGHSTAIVDIDVPREADIGKAMEVLSSACEEYYARNEGLFKTQPSVAGVNALLGSTVALRITCQTQPRQHFDVQRGLLAACKAALDTAGMGTPYPHVVVEGKEA